jgi:hypothetical protein
MSPSLLIESVSTLSGTISRPFGLLMTGPFEKKKRSIEIPQLD